MVVPRLITPEKIKDFFTEKVEDELRSPGEDNDIMPGLIPVGDTGLYRTPDEPADPTDCSRYPDSPFCGGNPFTLTPIGIEPEIINDGCNIGVRLDPAIAFIRLPPVALVYRKPECRNPEQKKPPDTQDLSPSIPPTRCNLVNGYEYAADGVSSKHGYTAVFILSKFWKHDNDLIPNRRIKTETIELEDFKALYKSSPPYQTNISEILQDYPKHLPLFYIRLKYISSIIENGVVVDSFNQTEELFYSGDFGKAQEESSPRFLSNSLIDEERVIGYIYINEYSKAQATLATIKNHTTTTNYIAQDGSNGGNLTITENWQAYVECGLPPLLPPPPPKDECCMTCCPPKDDQLTKLLLKKIKRLEECIGVQEYPASLPKSLISKDEGFIGNLIPNGNDEIPNLTQLLAKFIKYYDELMGQWEVAVEVKDSDPSTPGDQPKGIKLPNMAEAMAEMFTLAFQTHINSETLLNIATRTMIEGGTDKQQNFITYKLIQSITDYLGFKQKDVQAEMPLMFTLGETEFDKILQESKVKVPVQEMDEKFGFEVDLMRLRKIASILDSVYFKKLNPNGDIKAQILAGLLSKLGEIDKINGDDNDTNWEAFLRQAEEGYGGMPGVTDPSKPYGQDYAERPRIRDLTDMQPPEE